MKCILEVSQAQGWLIAQLPGAQRQAEEGGCRGTRCSLRPLRGLDCNIRIRHVSQKHEIQLAQREVRPVLLDVVDMRDYAVLVETCVDVAPEIGRHQATRVDDQPAGREVAAQILVGKEWPRGVRIPENVGKAKKEAVSFPCGHK